MRGGGVTLSAQVMRPWSAGPKGVAEAAGNYLVQDELHGLGGRVKDASELASVRNGVDNLDALYRALVYGLRGRP